LIEQAARSLVFDVLKKKIITALVTKMAFLSFPPFSWILGFFLDKVLEYLFVEGELMVAYAAIDYKTGQENKEAKEASESLGKSIQEGNADAIAKAKEDFKEKYRKLINHKSHM